MGYRFKTCVLALVVPTSVVHAFNFGGGSGGAISDGLGTDVPSFTEFTLNVAASGTIVQLSQVNIDFAHTWAGDVTMTLEHNGVSVTLMDVGETAGFGDSSNFDGVYSFANSGADLDGALAAAPGTNDTISEGVYGLDNTDGTLLSAFSGMDINGVWTLTVGDWAAADTGFVRTWSLDVVPAPGMAGLVGICGCVLLRRHRYSL